MSEERKRRRVALDLARLGASASASAAAIAANPGATGDSASTETDSSLSGAAYEVHITQAEGTHAVVIEDSSFNVLATQTGDGCSHGGDANTDNRLAG